MLMLNLWRLFELYHFSLFTGSDNNQGENASGKSGSKHKGKKRHGYMFRNPFSLQSSSHFSDSWGINFLKLLFCPWSCCSIPASKLSCQPTYFSLHLTCRFRRHKSDCLCAICVLMRKRKEREEKERIARGQIAEELKQEVY